MTLCCSDRGGRLLYQIDTARRRILLLQFGSLSNSVLSQSVLLSSMANSMAFHSLKSKHYIDRFTLLPCSVYIESSIRARRCIPFAVVVYRPPLSDTESKINSSLARCGLYRLESSLPKFWVKRTTGKRRNWNENKNKIENCETKKCVGAESDVNSFEFETNSFSCVDRCSVASLLPLRQLNYFSLTPTQCTRNFSFSSIIRSIPSHRNNILKQQHTTSAEGVKRSCIAV